jgi:hypothetical protein
MMTLFNTIYDIFTVVFIMVWGGSLNSRGSEYLRKIREADKVVGFLEKLKEKIQSEEKHYIRKTIDIISDYINRLSEEQE